MSQQSLLTKLVYVSFGVILVSASWFVGCQGNKQRNVPVKSPTEDIKHLGQDIKKTGQDLKKTTTIIEDNAQQGMTKTPVAAQPILNPHWTAILSATGIQNQLVENLKVMTTRAEEAEGKSNNLNKAYEAEKAARIKAQDSVTKELRRKYMAYSGILFFIALICGGIAVFSKGNKLALYGGLLAGAGSAACIFIVQSVALIPWIVGGMGIVALALVAYTLFFKNKKVDLFKKATEELVETVEAVKPKMSMAGRAAVFGDGPGKGEAYSIQSKETEALVKELRKEIENAPKLPPTVAVDYNGDGVIDARDVAPVTAVMPVTAVELVATQRTLIAPRPRVFN